MSAGGGVEKAELRSGDLKVVKDSSPVNSMGLVIDNCFILII